MKVAIKPMYNPFRKHKLAIASGLVFASMAAAMISMAPLKAESALHSTSSSHVSGLPVLTKLIKENRSAVVSIKVDFNHSNPRPKTDNRKFKQFDDMPKEFGELFKHIPQNPRGFDFGKRKKNAHGSGFIISADGYVVTNAHVINGSSGITVKLDDKREHKANVVGVDKLSDIALLKIDTNNLPFVSLGDSDKLDVGQWVVAIGTPFGLDYTATQGIVSALSRSLPADTYVPFIQTDAAVNPGNSGGPLFNLDGQVVGVNSQIYSRSGGYMGVSFAIPINIVKNVTEQLKDTGHVSRGWLGVGIQGINEALAKSLGRPDTKGTLISSVTASSPAARAGLLAGDVILQFDGKDVGSVSDLPILVGNTKIGKQVKIGIVRAGAAKTLDVTINKLKSEKDELPEVASLNKGSLGVAVESLSEAERVELKTNQHGVRVAKVFPDSPADNAGLRSGDIILSVGGKYIETPDKLKVAIKAAELDKPLAILLKRGEQALFIAVQLNT